MVLAVVAAAVLATSTVGQAGGDKNSIMGSWELKSMSFGGMDIPVQAGKSLTVTFGAGGKMTADDSGKKEEGTYKVEDSKKPRQIDVTTKKEGKEESMKGIYEITGDTLKIAFSFNKGGGAAARPDAFDAKDALIMTFKKASK
jgi:uncharacterized protein (TIGR03067 family)